MQQIEQLNLFGTTYELHDKTALHSDTKYGSSLNLTIDDSTYVVTAQLKDQDGNNLGTAQTIDLPLESVVVGGRYDSATKKVILTLKDGSEIEFSIADLVSGLLPDNTTFWGQTAQNGAVNGEITFDQASSGTYGKNSILSTSGTSMFRGLTFYASGVPLQIFRRGAGANLFLDNRGTIDFNDGLLIRTNGLSSFNYGFGNTSQLLLGVSYGTPSVFGHRLTSLADPTDNTDAATKNYVDTNTTELSTADYESLWN